MALSKETKRELKRLGLDQMGISDESTAKFYIRHYQAKENAARWQREAEEANRQAAANWPAELHPGVHGVETASGCEFDITTIEDDTVIIQVTKRNACEPFETDRADFLDRVKRGRLIIMDYTPEEMADGIVKPLEDTPLRRAIAANLQPYYDRVKPRFITKPAGEKGETA